MKYKVKYPHLYDELSLTDTAFEIVMEAFSQFDSIFDLSTLDWLLKNRKISAFSKFFYAIKSAVYRDKKLEFTVPQITAIIYQKLNNNKLRECYANTLLSLPDREDKVVGEIGFIEKLIANQLNPIEPLTFLDMLRAADYFSLCKEERIVAVFNLANFPEESKQLESIKSTYQAVFINVNKNPKEPAKWGVVRFKNPQGELLDPPEFYCESALLESEKSALEIKLNLDFKNLTQGKTANDASSGYAAITWLGSHYEPERYNLNADFITLLLQFLATQFDNQSFELSKDSKHLTGNLREVFKADFWGNGCQINIARIDESIDNKVCKFLAQQMVLPHIEGHPVQFDLANVLRAWSQYPGSPQKRYESFHKCRAKAERANLFNESNLLNDCKKQKFITMGPEFISLKIPDNLAQIDFAQFARQSRVVANLKFNDFHELGKKSFNDSIIASGLVLNIFRYSFKTPVITISLPKKYSLDQEDYEFILHLMSKNACITNLIINEDNPSLLQLKKALGPIICRNKWLAVNNYISPAFDDYWQRVTKYWLIYLFEHNDLANTGDEHQQFKESVRGMGRQGFEALLSFMQSSKFPAWVNNLSKSDGAFYLHSSMPIELLNQHLQAQEIFPFSALVIDWQTPQIDNLIALLTSLNNHYPVKKITINIDNPDQKVVDKIIANLNHHAIKNKWTITIDVPFLKQLAFQPQWGSSGSQYQQLNNVIHHNRNRKAAQELLVSLSENGESLDKQVASNASPYPVKRNSSTLKLMSTEEQGERQSWLLDEDEDVTLQMQNQQQLVLSHNKQMQAQVQCDTLRTREALIFGELVTYDTIDALYGEIVNPQLEQYAPLRQKGETVLQGLFHTWTNSPPQNNAPWVIYAITQAAMKELLRYPQRLTSGFNLANLPKGFFVQSDTKKGLILCFDPELGYHNQTNALTLTMDVAKPRAEKWMGDFRLLKLEDYVTPHTIGERDFALLALFAKVQPHDVNVEEKETHFDAFCQHQTDKQFKILLKKHKSYIIANWYIFTQVWQVFAREGLEVFLKEKRDFDIAADKVITLLFPDLGDLPFELTDKNLIAIAQTYYSYGDKPFIELVKKFKTIKEKLGTVFFDRFYTQVLSRSDNFTSYLTPEFFQTVDKMIVMFAKDAEEGYAQQAWLDLCEKHLAIVGWEKPEKLWQAFAYFTEQLQKMELSWDENWLQDLKPQNMLVVLDRIVVSLHKLPNNKGVRKRFLQQLAQLDLSASGVHYALQYDGFKEFEDLDLTEFNHGTPTYAPDLAKIYTWEAPQLTLNLKRLCASNVALHGYVLPSNIKRARHHLVLLAFCQYPSYIEKSVLQKDLDQFDDETLEIIAGHIHQVKFKTANAGVTISLHALVAYKEKIREHAAMLQKYPDGSFLAALSLLHYHGKNNFDRLMTLLTHINKPVRCNPALFLSLIKLATLIDNLTLAEIQQLIDFTQKQPAEDQLELQLCLEHILQSNPVPALYDKSVWQELLTIQDFYRQNRVLINQFTEKFIKTLSDKGLQFFQNAQIRQLNDDDVLDLSDFADHKQRLWNFIKNHVVISVDEDAQKALEPLLAFFKQVQFNPNSYLNEVEPLLAILEKTEQGGVWHATYLTEMLKSLSIEGRSYSFNILADLLHQAPFAASTFAAKVEQFPPKLSERLQNIIANRAFNRSQHSKLCQIAVKEYYCDENSSLLNDLLQLLVQQTAKANCDSLINVFVKAVDMSKVRAILHLLTPAMQIVVQDPSLAKSWDKTLKILLKMQLFEQETIKSLLVSGLSTEPNAKLLHILIWSNIAASGGSKSRTWNEKTSQKVLQQLKALSPKDLDSLVACYPKTPSPDIKVLHSNLNKSPQWLTDLLKHPSPTIRKDYKNLGILRQADLQRMLSETRIIYKDKQLPLTAEQIIRITVSFMALKALEAGDEFISGAQQPISAMDQQELASAYRQLAAECQRDPANDSLKVQFWAVLFEAMGRTTHKYPHMAQQFSLLANDICQSTRNRVLRLATGAGKSHYNALNAAKYVAQGKVVDIFTIKRSLAKRDQKDYQAFFNYLGINTAFILPDSQREEYMNASIHYGTLGDYSLFIDEQLLNGAPINIPPSDRVGLGDEIDDPLFLNPTIQYNYALPAETPPRERLWFYQQANQFYNDFLSDEAKIYRDKHLKEFIKVLRSKVADDPEKTIFVDYLERNPLDMVRWLRAAHRAHKRQMGIDFTVVEEEVEVNDVLYPLQEIIPLSKDSQKLNGASFSGGVHQLLAVRLNKEAQRNNKPQNYHIHPESNILSSQVASHHFQTLWGHWEGLTATLSAMQSAYLDLYNAEVFHVPTNQKEKRLWHKPLFYSGEVELMAGFYTMLERALAEKKSVLIACKNDQEVNRLKTLLTNKFSKEQLSNAIFYTNEDKLSSQEILQQKTNKEQWQSGKKQNPTTLVSAGFTRGDNPNVDVVFIFHATDQNDLLQKGGRTARNGEFGEVFQFYVTPDLQQEKEQLLKMLHNNPNARHLKIDLHQRNNESQEEACVRHVLLLREQVFLVQNLARQGYQYGLAQFTQWTTKIRCQLTHEKITEFNDYLIRVLHRLEKQWLDISNEKFDKAETQIRRIEQAITDEMQTINNCWGEKTTQWVAFKLNQFTVFIPDLIDKEEESCGQHSALTVIAAKLAGLRLTAQERRELGELSNSLTKLNPGVLDKLLAELPLVKSWQDFKERATRLNQPGVMPSLRDMAISAHVKDVQNPTTSYEERFYNECEQGGLSERTKQQHAFMQAISVAERIDENKQALLTRAETISYYLPATEQARFLRDFTKIVTKINPAKDKYAVELLLNSMEQVQQAEHLLDLVAHLASEQQEFNHALLEKLFTLAHKDWLVSYINLSMLPYQKLQPNHYKQLCLLTKKKNGFADHIESKENHTKILKALHVLLSMDCDVSVCIDYLIKFAKDAVHPREGYSFTDQLIWFIKAMQVVDTSPEIIAVLFELIKTNPALKLDTIMQVLEQCGRNKREIKIKTILYATKTNSYTEDQIRNCCVLLNDPQVEEIIANIPENSMQTCLQYICSPHYSQELLIIILKKCADAHLQEDSFTLLLPKLLSQLTQLLTKTYWQQIVDFTFDHLNLKEIKEAEFVPALNVFFEHCHEGTDIEWSVSSRALLLRLLHQRHFVSSQWSSSENNALLTAGLSYYTKQARQLLQDKKSVPAKKGLSAEQQQKLCLLADEMRIIGVKEPKDIRPKLGSQDSPQSLENALKQSAMQYNGRWFKSSSRREQFQTLLVQINQLEGKGYKEVLAIIQQARSNAMDNDNQVNKSWLRTLWKHNRSGRSVFLDKLNEMEAIIIKHWLEDPNLLSSFTSYSKNCKSVYVALVGKFIAALDSHKHTELLAKLHSIEEQDALSSSQIQALTTYLNANLSSLTGAQKTIANEILIRSEALENYLLPKDSENLVVKDAL